VFRGRTFPTNLIYGIGAGSIGAVVASLAAPQHTQTFYNAAVQVVPVFLVALALERSLAETLGTETSVISEQLDRVDREWTPPSSQTRRYYGVGLKLREIHAQSFRWKEIAACRAALEGQSRIDIVRTLPGGEDPTAAELREISLVLASRALGRRPRFQRRTRRVGRDELLVEWDALYAALTDRGKERAKDDVRYEVGTAYRSRRRRQQISVSASVCTLAIAEILAFVGLLSPGSAYPGLFIATAGAIVASFVAITVDAVSNLFVREIDVQSAGLDWSRESTGSHWDSL